MKHNNSNGFFSDWQVKVVCLLVAILLYYVFSFGMPSERRITMPLDITLPQDMTVTSNIPETVDIVVRGDEKKIYMVDVSRIKLSADFSEVHTEGVATEQVSIDYTDLLDYIDVTDLSIYTNPAIVKLYFE